MSIIATINPAMNTVRRWTSPGSRKWRASVFCSASKRLWRRRCKAGSPAMNSKRRARKARRETEPPLWDSQFWLPSAEQRTDCASAINRGDEFATVAQRENANEGPASRHRGASRSRFSVATICSRACSPSGGEPRAGRREIGRQGSELHRAGCQARCKRR